MSGALVIMARQNSKLPCSVFPITKANTGECIVTDCTKKTDMEIRTLQSSQLSTQSKETLYTNVLGKPCSHWHQTIDWEKRFLAGWDFLICHLLCQVANHSQNLSHWFCMGKIDELLVSVSDSLVDTGPASSGFHSSVTAIRPITMYNFERNDYYLDG